MDGAEISFCVTGWYFSRPEYFKKLYKVKDSVIYIVSHKPAESIPDWVYDYVPRERMYIEPNVGYDIGCYQQFLEKKVFIRFFKIFRWQIYRPRFNK